MNLKDFQEAVKSFQNKLERCGIKKKKSGIDIDLCGNYFTLHFENDDVVANQEFSVELDEIVPLYFYIDEI